MRFSFLSARNLFLLVLLLAACAPNPPKATSTSVPIASTQASISSPSYETLTGEWLGGATKPDGSIASLLINFDNAELNIEPSTATWKITTTQNGDAVNVSVMGEPNDPFREIEFLGRLVNGNLVGEFTWDGYGSSVVFLPLVSVDASALEKYEGVYRFESGRTWSILASRQYSSSGLRFFSQTLMMTDFESGALRSLYPVDEFTFLIGALRVVGAPFSGRIHFDRDDQGNVQGLTWWETPHDLFSSPVPGFYASRVSYTSEDITFTSADGVKLAGRLSVPESNGPLPAFMMLHGSEQGNRDNFGNQVMAHYMISRGIAVLNYDKRGVGDSEGAYQEAASPQNLKKQAEDAVAGVEYLSTRPEIDAKRIGLVGFSQAGWVMPLAATQSDAIAFLVSLSGPVVSTSHENMFSSYTNDGDSGRNFDDAEITQKLRDLKPAGFDPVPILAELQQPGVWLWGSVDKSVPVTLRAENLQALIDLGKSNFSYQVLLNGDHNLNASAHGWFNEIPYSPGVLYYPALGDWLEENVLLQKQ